MPTPSLDELLKQAKERHRAGDLAAAEAAYQGVLAINPKHAAALNLLAVLKASRGELDGAIECLRKAVAAEPYYAEAYFNLGKTLQDSGKLNDAADAYRRAAACRPGYARAFDSLAVVLQKLHQFDPALAAYESAARAQPNFPETHFNRGTLLEEMLRWPEAIAAYRLALSQQPGYGDALINLGNVLQKLGQFEEGIQILQQAIQAKPQSATAFNTLGNALKEIGRMDDAMACFQRVVELGANAWGVGNYLYCSHFHPAWDARRIFDAHAQWNRQFALPLMPAKVPTPHVRTGDRLRVGFVSQDLREHPVGRFMLPLAENLDRDRFEISYFSDAIIFDGLSQRIKASAAHWHDTRHISEAELAERIGAERIDVLIDLTMHMQGSRLLTFARKPAPLQLTYLAYCSTTGVTAIDYRISDPFLDPVGMDESIYAEKTARLPHTYWCYRAPASTPLVERSGAETVFGCLNNYCKISDATWDAWIAILKRVERSSLLVFCPEGRHRETARDRFRKHGIDPSRLAMVSRVPGAKYFQTYDQIDIALDPFPYGGGTTTLDGLWCGVPVVSLVGQTAVGRGGASILNNLGKKEWLADNPGQYVAIAVDLAQARINRTQLRDELAASKLMDERRFALDFGNVIAGCWHDRSGQHV